MDNECRANPTFTDSPKAFDNSSSISSLHVISDFILNWGGVREVQLLPYNVEEVTEVFKLFRNLHEITCCSTCSSSCSGFLG